MKGPGYLQKNPKIGREKSHGENSFKQKKVKYMDSLANTKEKGESSGITTFSQQIPEEKGDRLKGGCSEEGLKETASPSSATSRGE